MSDKYTWIAYVLLAGLAWGTYVPLVFYGGNELGGKPSSRIMAILCVGMAYFFIAVLVPLALFLTGQQEWPDMKTTGLVFASLAGVAGAVGAICVIFATKAAIGSAKAEGLDPDTYKMFIAPLIFGLAPAINTVVSLFWHPKPGDPFHFGLKSAHPLLYVGILFVGVGAALVLYSKELGEKEEKEKAKAAKLLNAAPAVAAGPAVSSPS